MKKDSNFFNDLSERLSEALPPQLKAFKKDMEKNFRTILQAGFAKMDLVTREEFDAQTKVLTRTRKKIEDLEARVKELEKLIDDK